MPEKLREITLKLPEGIVKRWLEDKTEKAEHDKSLAFEMVLSLLRKRTISASRGAELLGMHYHDFLALMTKHEIAIIDYEKEEDLTYDLKTFDKVMNTGANI